MTMQNELAALRDRWRAIAEQRHQTARALPSDTLHDKTHLAAVMENGAAKQVCADELDAILAEYADWVTVPKRPTEDMLMAAWRESGVYSGSAYSAMIQAAAKAEEE